MLPNKIKYLVADTTAFLNNTQLQEYAENVLTVPDVVNEVKHRRQIRRLVVLPFDLKVQEPTTENLKYVTEFSKQTGDYASLSAIDLKVIALTYELEKENVGTQHLRTEPIVRRVIASKEKPEELLDKSMPVGFFLPRNEKNCDSSVTEDKLEHANDKSENAIQEIKQEKDEKIIMSPDNSDAGEEDSDLTEEELTKCLEALKTCDLKTNEILVPVKNDESTSEEADEEYEDNSDDDGNWITPKNYVIQNPNSDAMVDDILAPQKNEQYEDDESDDADGEEDDDEGDDSSWITPKNFEDVKKRIEGDAEDVAAVVVGCMSTDYAIQNVLKQMNLNIVALNGKVIKHLRTYILRCYACFKTTSIMTKIFCPSCGNKTLKKVAVSLDENGQQVIHINLRRPLTRKYKNQSTPRPEGGKHSNNPILVEDQPLPKQMPTRVAKTKTNALNDDYVAVYSPFAVRDVDSRSAMLRAKGNLKQWARNNAYEENRRRRGVSRLVK